MKKIFALVTAGALALSLSACQASSQQTTDTTTKSADSTDTAAAKTMVLSQAKRSLSSARSQPAAEPTLVPAILHRLFLK